MLQDKKVLEQYIVKKCDKIAIDNDMCKSIYTYANTTYDIPKSIVSDYIFGRVSMSNASEYELFILLDSIKHATNAHNVDIFYSEQEINYYKKNKYKIEKIKFPLVFKMIQIEEDQWIGKIDIKDLMKLRRAQMINYNVNAQRTMQRIIKGGKESYKISLNQKAVSEIAESFENKSFISNAITLNIPVESNAVFYYDEETCSLIIKSLDYFDITDGYHRFIAACQVSDLNSDFNYNMELRIVNFTEDKARQMIWQEDQKTKMRKIDSESMNMNKAANTVVTRLNENPRCNLQGLISLNGGLVSFSELAQLVDYFYFKDIKKEKERSIRIQAVNELTNNFNTLTEYNTEYLENKMKYSTLLSFMFCFDYFKENIPANICEIIELTANGIENNKELLRNKTPRKILMSKVENIMKGVI